MKTSRQAGARVDAYPRITLERFQRTLIRMRDLTCAELGGLAELIPAGSLQTLSAGTAAETPGQGSHAAEFAVAEAEQARLLAYMDSLDGALQRIAEGRYGRCVVCGELIDTNRLEGLPCAERCTACQRATTSSATIVHPQLRRRRSRLSAERRR